MEPMEDGNHAPRAPKRAKNASYCCVPQCTNGAKEGMSFYHFPKDIQMRQLWKTILKMGKCITDHDRVCKDHFVETDFIPQGECLNLLF